jgi:hypothetical protein
MSLAAYLAAIILFILAALGVSVAGADARDLAYVGLASFAAGHVLP